MVDRPLGRHLGRDTRGIRNSRGVRGRGRHPVLYPVSIIPTRVIIGGVMYDRICVGPHGARRICGRIREVKARDPDAFSISVASARDIRGRHATGDVRGRHAFVIRLGLGRWWRRWYLESSGGGFSMELWVVGGRLAIGWWRRDGVSNARIVGPTPVPLPCLRSRRRPGGRAGGRRYQDISGRCGSARVSGRRRGDVHHGSI